MKNEDDKNLKPLIRFDILRANYNKKKLCQCREPNYEIDLQNGQVSCCECNAIVEPFEVLLSICKQYERIERQLDLMYKQRKSIAGYKPHLKTIKDLERNYRRANFSTVPCCPRCKKPFDLTEIEEWNYRKNLPTNFPQKGKR